MVRATRGLAPAVVSLLLFAIDARRPSAAGIRRAARPIGTQKKKAMPTVEAAVASRAGEDGEDRDGDPGC